ncbi:NAD-dependent protein deacetylase SRT1 [Diplonema papillatum]|nr:NAD-dependent protein deacetylase SRT1 [Diplonema papillatum]|eukprot:gene14170-21711_t
MNGDESTSVEYKNFAEDFERYVAGNLREAGCDDYHTVQKETETSLREKVEKLKGLLRASKYTVVYTGAGVSTSAGLPDYRGPDGVWTRKAERKGREEAGQFFEEEDGMQVQMTAVVPTAGHLWLARAVEAGVVRHVVSTNVDNLHVRSGLKRRMTTRDVDVTRQADDTPNLSELHGNLFVSHCETCQRYSTRETAVPAPHSRATTSKDPMNHVIEGETCPACSSSLRDNVMHFHSTAGDVPVAEVEYDTAWLHAVRCELFVVFGSSLSVPTACDLVDEAAAKGATVVIVNSQKTPKDKFASLIVHHPCDDVFARLPLDALLQK